MLTKAIEDEMCPQCDSGLKLGLKEEPTGWKVYVICPSGGESCPDKRIGMIPRTAIGHTDDVIDEAERLFELC